MTLNLMKNNTIKKYMKQTPGVFSKILSLYNVW